MDNQQYRPNLLDVPISFFEFDQQRGTFANVPAQQTTLRRITLTKFYRATIEAIRAEPDKEEQDKLKKRLPAITPVALLHHRKRNTTFDQKISQQWPLMMGDVDRKDNPGICMVELKTRLCRLSYVLLCGYSVRGGLWFVVRLPDNQTPESLAAHFRYLQKIFGGKKDGKYYGKFGVKLDSTKGGNPTDLRFVSYDADPYTNENATVMVGTYTPPPPKPLPIRKYDQSRSNGPDEGELLNQLVRFTQSAGEGQRHETLLKVARLAGGFIAAGRMNEQTAVYELETIASEWPTFTKSQKTIRDGIRYGMAVPIPNDTPYGKATRLPPQQRSLGENSRPRIVVNGQTDYGEILTVERCETYPAEWDEEAECELMLTTSPNRDLLARILDVTPDQLPLQVLTYPQIPGFSRYNETQRDVCCGTSS